MNSQKGLSFLEFLISVLVTALLVTAFVRALTSTSRSFKQGTDSLNSSIETRVAIPALDESLMSAQKIVAISLSSSSEGYIQYQRSDDATVVIYLNSSDNQSRFKTNGFSNQSLVLAIGSIVDEITTNVVSFNVTSYTEDASFFRVASPNNQSAPVSLDEISSVKLAISRQINAQQFTTHKLLQRLKTRLSLPGSISFGDTYNGTTTFPFAVYSNFQGFSTSNIGFSRDTGANEADGAHIATSSHSVKIRGTALYFESIQSAIDSAVSGNDVLVASRTDGYTEAITMKAGVDLYGGYNRFDWSRHITANETVIYTFAGLTDKTVKMANNTTFDGFTIRGGELLAGISANGVSPIQVSNCRIVDTDRPFEIIGSSGIFYNNAVTGNEHCVFINGSTAGLSFTRNRFYSKNLAAKSNIFINLSKNITFSNNIISNGYTGFNIKGQSSNRAEASVHNNVITAADNIGMLITEGIVSIQNNLFYNNGVGLFANPSNLVTAQHNFFSSNQFGNSTGTLSLSFPSNVSGNISDATVDTVDFYTKDGGPLIDAGNAAASYNDVYTGGAPSKGAARNDIGAYGGPESGRVGPAIIHAITQGSNTATVASNSWPGDWLLFKEGAHSVSAMSAKAYQYVIGEGLNRSFLTVSGGAGFGIQLGKKGMVENLQILGNNQIGLQVESPQTAQATAILIRGAQTAISLANSAYLDLFHTTLVKNTTALSVQGSATADLDYNIIASNNGTAVSIAGGTKTYSSYTNFFGNGTNLSGSFTVESNTQTTDPLFWDPSQDIYLLQASSNAINADGARDLGAHEGFSRVGVLTSPLIPASVHKAYKTLVVSLSGSAGNVPSINAFLSTIQCHLISDEIPVTVDPTIVVTNNASNSYTFLMPPTAISDQFKIRATITSYQTQRTPFINRMTLTW